MKKTFTLSLFILFIINISFAQDTLHNPVDVKYRASTQNYFVSNAADGNGYILKLDSEGQVIETFFDDLSYPGGICLIDNILYVVNNTGLWGDNLPSYIVGIDLNTNEQVLNYHVDESNTYLDLMDTDQLGNLYIGNSADGVNSGGVYKFNIAEEEISELVSDKSRPLGVCYDHLDDRIIFTNSSPNLSFIWSVNRDGSDPHKVFYINERLNTVVMYKYGGFYYTNWGSDLNWEDETIYKTGHEFNWDSKISENHNRPFGMCFGKDDILVICNFGGHSLSFIDTEELSTNSYSAKKSNYNIFPNPSHGKFQFSTQNYTTGVEFSIFNIMGQKVYSEKFIDSDQLVSTEFNLRSLASGTYIVYLKDNESISQIKLIIE